MYKNSDAGAEGLGGYTHHEGRLAQPLGSNKGRDLVIGIRVALWTLQGRTALSLHFLPASTPSNTDSEMGDCTRAMVEGVISYVREDLWVLLNH
jgi:hypothetical protein